MKRVVRERKLSNTIKRKNMEEVRGGRATKSRARGGRSVCCIETLKSTRR